MNFVYLMLWYRVCSAVCIVYVVWCSVVCVEYVVWYRII